MKPLVKILGLFCVLNAAMLAVDSSPSAAQGCNYYAGSAVTGQSVLVDLCSISRASYRSVDFVYSLGGERIEAQANCEAGTWTTFPERQVNRPQSQATSRMLDVVCTFDSRGVTSGRSAWVIDPPSNVRATPNGSIICSIPTRQRITTYGSVGSWYYTDACGEMGVIHNSQIRF
ncbi:hypothetical protein V2H45_23115 [Tumidithrix elongata RA019]|uniref:Secreted protein n=1 Tax=Tumidithrix elongata BACA0141 TaxID=2716417 RepID=A0AAW9Q3D9_9CYAN|nr:hypothetical protein [Tumidithrix elongata RA019]